MSRKGKLSIKPFRHQVQMDPNYADNTWKLLKNAIHEIHRQNAGGLSFEELYRNAYNMVLHRYGELLYKGLQQVVEEHLRQVVSSKLMISIDDNFLLDLNAEWSDHKICMFMIRDILMYMDRVYVVHHNVDTVYDLGLVRFRDIVARNPKIKERLLKLVLDMIHKERTGEVINRSLLKNITQMLVELGVNSRAVYEEDFERPFLESSTKFYRMESQEFLASNACNDYLIKVEMRLKEESSRVSHYLDPSTEQKIRECVERELISSHIKHLIEMEGSGLVVMLRDDKIDDLHRMYQLFQRVPNGHNMMKEVISNYLRETGKSLVAADSDTKPVNNEKAEAEENPQPTAKESSPAQYIQNLLDLRDKYTNILTRAFNRDKSFKHTMDQAFEYFINLNKKSPESISLFIEEKLRRGSKEMTEEEIEIVLDKVIILFRFVQDKDVFEKYYKHHLAKRLLLGRSISEDAERSVISKLKTECGYQFTSKLEGMFNDMQLSAKTMEGFKTFLADSMETLTVDLNVQVLTTGFWPTQNVPKCNLPAEIAKCCAVFESYYKPKHTGRSINWQTNMGTAELRAQFGPKKHELSVSTYQMIILLSFNQFQSQTFKEIIERTGIPATELKRNLFTLAYHPKNKIITKEPNNKQIVDADVFCLNHTFKSKLFKVKVVGAAEKDTEVERQETRTKIDEDRKLQVEAAVVRIMKSRRTMEHSNLISEVTKQLSSRFFPNPVLIKKRIESLIEREYLERSKTDRKMYQYLA
eukprot:TRINITY_DN3204_c0_g1_i1.p1 TRINITY_DN3204_c0_g1~~TRINITY_DN3204_c0_g1_i1.p1  ORF type:complete len:755 (-),score=227.71 TRINITY_DN3204_c0_g1_i1:56-2320(-)